MIRRGATVRYSDGERTYTVIRAEYLANYIRGGSRTRWLHLRDDQTGRRHLAHPDALVEVRTYCVGVPMVVTVDSTGRVTFEPDLSEVDDLWQGVPHDDDLNPLYSEAQIADDIRTIRAHQEA